MDAAGELDLEALTDALDGAVARRPFTGLIAVDVGGQRVLERCHGFAHRGLAVPVRPDTRFAVASGSKLFTALALMRLVEDGRLRLDGRVRDVLGADLPLIDDTVTIEQLLAHTSGIGDYLDEEADGDPADFVLAAPVHTLTTAEAFLPLLDGFPQAFPPGERFAYNNGAYVVLAIVVERVTGRGFHEVVQETVFGPAGMASSGYPRLDELPGDAALGYLLDDGDLVNTLRLPVRGSGDGGAFTTAVDLHRCWCAFDDGAVVSGATVAAMTEPRHDVPREAKRSGLGVFLNPAGQAWIIEGYDAGVSFRSTYLPASRTTVSVLGNSSEGAWPAIHALAEVIDASTAG